jgi:hypothetical protein
VRLRTLLVLLLLLVLLGGLAHASSPTDLELGRRVIGSGGGRVEQSFYIVHSTLGQGIVGTTSQSPYDLCAGFWCNPAEVQHRIYLPLLARR